jgi:hypothetical protein
VQDTKTTAFARQTTTLALTAATPHAVIDVLGQGVLQALRGDGTALTDALGGQYPETVAREEDLRRVVPALAVCHPFSTHVVLLRRSFSSQYRVVKRCHRYVISRAHEKNVDFGPK